MNLLTEVLWLAVTVLFLSGCLIYAVNPHTGISLFKRAVVLAVALALVRSCFRG